MPEKNKKLLQILKSARKLFWKHGFRRVSIEEVCKNAAVSKMTFYRFFPNKIAVAKAVFDLVVEEGLQKFRSILKDESSSQEKIRKIILMKIEGTHDISKEFLEDFYSNPDLGLREYVDKRSRHSWNEILKDFKQSQKKGWIRSDIKPEFLFYFAQNVGEILTDENLLKLYDTPQELILELTNFFAYGISPREK